MQDELIKTFISYSNKDKEIAGLIQKALDKAGCTSFMAHENISVSESWRTRIKHELENMDVFVPLLTNNYKESIWANQEAGYALSIGVPIIPLQLQDCRGVGFLDEIQHAFVDPSNRWGCESKISECVNSILPKIKCDKKRKTHIFLSKLEKSCNFLNAEKNMELVVDENIIDRENVNSFIEICANNSQIYNANMCKKQISDICEKYGVFIEPQRLTDIYEKIK